MGQIEELPDDFDERLNLNEQPPGTQAPPSKINNDGPSPAVEETPFPINEERLKELENDPRAPKMPPTMASVKSHTSDELWSMMNKTPLFMTDINQAGDESKSIFPRVDAISMTKTDDALAAQMVKTPCLMPSKHSRTKGPAVKSPRATASKATRQQKQRDGSMPRSSTPRLLRS